MSIYAARFLKLKAGSVIKKHRDSELAFEKGEARLHFPIFTNPAVEFCSEDERIPLMEGECWYLNANLPHSVANHGETDRVHLVVDCEVNDWLKSLMQAATQIEKKNMVDTSQILDTIAMLRLQIQPLQIAWPIRWKKNLRPQGKKTNKLALCPLIRLKASSPTK